MRKYRWTVQTESVPSGQDEAAEPIDGLKTERHTVECTFSRLKGRLTVCIDGDEFKLPAGLLGLKAARREPFRLGDEQAVLAVDAGGRAELILRGEAAEPDEVTFGII